MSGRQPGAIPSIRRITTPSGRRVTLGVSAGKRRSQSATYTARLVDSRERVVISRRDSVWRMSALRVAYNSADTGRPVREWVAIGEFPTLALAAERVV